MWGICLYYRSSIIIHQASWSSNIPLHLSSPCGMCVCYVSGWPVELTAAIGAGRGPQTPTPYLVTAPGIVENATVVMYRVAARLPNGPYERSGRVRLFCFHQPAEVRGQTKEGLKERKEGALWACWDSSQLSPSPAYSISVDRQNGILYLGTLFRRDTWISYSGEWFPARVFWFYSARTVLMLLWFRSKGDGVRGPLVMTTRSLCSPLITFVKLS